MRAAPHSVGRLLDMLPAGCWQLSRSLRQIVNRRNPLWRENQGLDSLPHVLPLSSSCGRMEVDHHICVGRTEYGPHTAAGAVFRRNDRDLDPPFCPRRTRVRGSLAPYGNTSGKVGKRRSDSSRRRGPAGSS